MSIEGGVATGAPKAAAQTAAGHGHGKAQSGAAPGGFAALLMNLDGEPPALDAKEMSTGNDKATVTADAATDPALAAGVSAAAAQAIALPTPPVPSTVTAPVPAGGDALTASLRVARPQTAAQAPAVDEGKDKSLPDLALAAQEREPTDSSAEMQPLLRQAAMAQRMAQSRTQGAEVAAQAAKEKRGEDVAARLGWQLGDRANPNGSPAQVLLTAGTNEWSLRPAERRSEKGSRREGDAGEVGALMGQPAADGLLRADAVPAAAPDAGLMTETRVAQQVSYWVSHGVQNAELEIDGPAGEGTVNVNIQLQGQEARVEFRADQVQTRQVLEDSMPHLRELLAREGLVLSGVSVGSSGADGGAGRQPSGRQGGRQATVAVPELPVAASARAALPPGRSLDLFV